MTVDKPVVLCKCGEHISDVTCLSDKEYHGRCLHCNNRYVAKITTPGTWKDHSCDWIKA